MRAGKISRKTKETEIDVSVDLDGTGAAKISTGIGFFDHMLEQLSRHSLIDIAISAKGDLYIDQHHTVEDVGIALGQAIRQALGDRAGINRYADAACSGFGYTQWLRKHLPSTCRERICICISAY